MKPVWLFDLDNTLHDADPHIFPHINRSMTAYLMRLLQLEEAEANALRLEYWKRYGATLLGLMRNHRVCPREFLRDTHRFTDLKRMVVAEKALGHMLRRLPGRKIVFSNGPRAYAEAVLRIMGVEKLFDDVYAVESMRFHPKPGRRGFHHLLKDHGLKAADCILVEDSAVNLRTAKRLGMRTVWVSRSLRRPPYVDHRIHSVLALGRRAIRGRSSG